MRLSLIYHLRRPAKKDAQERRENAAKEEAAAAALPKTSDIRYKTGAANMLEVFAYIVWVCGGISVIGIAILASQLRYSYYSSETTGTTLFFLAVAAAVSALFFGGLLYGASKLLIDVHAARVNLEQLNKRRRRSSNGPQDLSSLRPHRQ